MENLKNACAKVKSQIQNGLSIEEIKNVLRTNYTEGLEAVKDVKDSNLEVTDDTYYHIGGILQKVISENYSWVSQTNDRNTLLNDEQYSLLDECIDYFMGIRFKDVEANTCFLDEEDEVEFKAYMREMRKTVKALRM